jgi:Flp pilus assembly protein TadG
MTRRGCADRGTVTAELAVVLPAVVVLCAALLFAGQAVVRQVQCVDAARAAARLAARGDSPAAVTAEAGRRAPPDASVQVVRSGAAVRVEVSVPVHGPGVRWLGVTARASATAMVEPPP